MKKLMELVVPHRHLHPCKSQWWCINNTAQPVLITTKIILINPRTAGVLVASLNGHFTSVRHVCVVRGLFQYAALLHYSLLVIGTLQMLSNEIGFSKQIMAVVVKVVVKKNTF